LAKDIVDKLDEFLAFASAMIHSKAKPGGGRSAEDQRFKELVSQVVWHDEKDNFKAIEMVAKEERLKPKMKKKLIKFFIQTGKR
jgi:hypothetical protein